MNDKQKIIIIEDDLEINELYTEHLSGHYSLLIFGSGEAALECVEKTADDICLAIIDYKLPDMTGIEVLKAVKKIRPSVPILFVTAYGDEAVAVNVFRHGAKDYLKKPFTFGELRDKINFLSSIRSLANVKEKRSVLTDNSCRESHKLFFNLEISCKSKNIHKALQFIDMSYKEKINLRRIASIAGLSRFHFCRVFKESMGISYQNYILNLRVARAKEMLKSGKYSVTETAFFVGFSDLTHFGRIFKKIVGFTPIQYKRIHKDKQQSLQITGRCKYES